MHIVSCIIIKGEKVIEKRTLIIFYKYIWQVFFTVEQFWSRKKNKNSVFKKLTEKNFKIIFGKIINQII